SFFIHPVGIISGTTGSLLYWLAQHGVQRGSQPGYYYLIQLVVYEPLVLLWSIVGLVMVGVLIARRLLDWRAARPQAATNGAKRRTKPSAAKTAAPLVRTAGDSTIDWRFAMPVLLAWWSVATLGLYSWAGEKMPWLTIHVALPLVLLGAWAFGRTLSWWLVRTTSATSDSASALDWQPADDEGASSNGHAQISLSERPRGRIWDSALLIYLGVFGIVAALCFLLIINLINPAVGRQDFVPFLFPAALLLIALLT